LSDFFNGDKSVNEIGFILGLHSRKHMNLFRDFCLLVRRFRKKFLISVPEEHERANRLIFLKGYKIFGRGSYNDPLYYVDWWMVELLIKDMIMIDKGLAMNNHTAQWIKRDLLALNPHLVDNI